MPYLRAPQVLLSNSYIIDYSAFLEELGRNQLFEDKGKCYRYIKTWIKVMKKHDAFESTYDNASAYKAFDFKPFVQEIHYQFNTMYLHFNISTIEHILKENPGLYELKDVKVDEFFNYGDSGHIYRSEVDSLDLSYSRNSNPVYIVPFKTALNSRLDINYLLIDGNHRVSMAYYHKEQYISAYILSEKLLKESRIFSTSFDKMLYAFYNECGLFSHLKKAGKSDDELLSQSYLSKLGYEFI